MTSQRSYGSPISDKIKWDFFQVVAVSLLLYGCTLWSLMKHIEKKLGGNYTSILRAVLNKSLKQRHRKQYLYSHLPSSLQTIQERRIRHAVLYRISKDELISDILLWTPTHGYQLYADTGCSLADLPKSMNNWDG